MDSLLEPASSGQSMNCSFSHVRVGFTRESGRLLLGFTSWRCFDTGWSQYTGACSVDLATPTSLVQKSAWRRPAGGFQVCKVDCFHVLINIKMCCFVN